MVETWHSSGMEHSLQEDRVFTNVDLPGGRCPPPDALDDVGCNLIFGKGHRTPCAHRLTPNIAVKKLVEMLHEEGPGQDGAP